MICDLVYVRVITNLKILLKLGYFKDFIAQLLRRLHLVLCCLQDILVKIYNDKVKRIKT